MKKSWLLFFFLILGGCATRQVVTPVNLSGQVIPENNAPVPTVVVPAVPKIEPQSAQPAVSKDDLNQERIIEQGQAIEVVSNPAGARIELNGKLLGGAPGKFYVIRKPNRYGFLPRMTITAIPPEGVKGQYPQTKVFDGYTSTPEKIYFDMSLPPPLPRIEGGYY
jgi:hypothetical protein